MKPISLLDCTLRDGGYVNDWNFGNSTILCMFERMVNANIDIIEVGFLDERVPYDENRTIQPSTECFDRIFANSDKKDCMVVAMIDYGTCGSGKIGPCAGSFLDGIRIIFKKPNMDGAVAFGRELMQKGYKVFYQLVSITAYSDRDILDFCNKANSIRPFGVSIVDTYGLMHDEQLLHYFDLLDHNLNGDIVVGYHPHNNFQLAYANTIEIVRQPKTHRLVIDATVFGMGKSAGNAPIELTATFLNRSCGGDYKIEQILEMIDTDILRIYRKQYWGYSLLYFLAAANDCHPEYIHYLLEKKTLSVEAVDRIVKRIAPEYRLDYKKEYIESLYFNYQKSVTDSCTDMETLKEALSSRALLVIGPGKSILRERKRVNAFIQREKPILIAVNCLPGMYNLDYLFISNSKRYSMLFNRIKERGEELQIIATSNITPISNEIDYRLNYERYLDENVYISDNSFAMLLNFLAAFPTRRIVLAGFDGFREEGTENFFEEYMDFSADYELLRLVNQAIRDKIKTMEKDIRFLTPSVYEVTYDD